MLYHGRMCDALSNIIAITKTDDVYDKEKVMRCVKDALLLLGGIGKFVKGGNKVLLKPNFVAPRPQHAGATTDLRVLEEIVNEVRDCGATPIVAESSGIEFDTDLTFKILGVKDWADREGIELVNVDREKSVKVKIDNGCILKTVLVPRIVKNVDIIINVPKIKTHVLTTVSLGLKNIMGLLLPSEKRKMHTRGLEYAIMDLKRAITPDLTVVDGIIAMQSDGAVYGDPINLGVIVSGENVIGVDYVCCRIMCVEAEEVAYFKRAFGAFNPNDLQVLGEDIDLVKKTFVLPRKKTAYRLTYESLFYLDAVLSKIIRKKTVLSTIFRYIGTRPKIEHEKCQESCRECLDVCPVQAIDKNRKIRTNLCVRCLFCYEACKHNAIKILGHSKPSGS